MSKELTEKWKNGSLSYGYYYIKEDEDADIEIAFLDQDGDLVGLGERYVTYRHDKLEIIEKAPTYEEFQNLKEYERIITSYTMKPIDYDMACETVHRLLDENKELRERLM